MPTTGYGRSIVPVPVYHELQAHRTAHEWEVILATWALDPPDFVGSNWHASATVTVWVDDGAVGSLRLVTSSGESSNPGTFQGWVQGAIIGWFPVSSIGQRLWLMGTTLSGAGSAGLHVVKAEAMLMSAPPSSQVPGPTYPPGYTPPPAGSVYPPRYDTNPYTI